MILTAEQLQQRYNQLEDELENLHDKHRTEIFFLYEIWRKMSAGKRRSQFVKKQGQRQAEEIIKLINSLMD